MSKNLVIVVLLLERIAFAVVGLIAAINHQIGWSIFMGAMIIVLIASTKIKLRGEK